MHRYPVGSKSGDGTKDSATRAFRASSEAQAAIQRPLTHEHTGSTIGISARIKVGEVNKVMPLKSCGYVTVRPAYEH